MPLLKLSTATALGIGVPFLAGALSLTARPAEAAIRFRDATAAWGIDFRHHHGGRGDLYMIETMGSGVVAFDYDDDGDPDLLFIDSGPLPLAGDGEVRPAHRLYRNDGGGRFVAQPAASLDAPCYGMGGTAADVDGDGDRDLFLTCVGPNRLFRNEGDGSFREVGAAAGVDDPLWGTSAAFLDGDGDGDLDLYVANYVDFSFANNPMCGRPAEKLRSYCHPDVYEAAPDRYYVGRGDGTFVESSAALGLAETTGKGLGVVASDFDGDGRSDLFVANDMTPSFLFHNQGSGRFAEIGMLAGVALSDQARLEAGMGIASADFDGDGRDDLVVTHLSRQSTVLHLNRGNNLFTDSRFHARLAEPSIDKVGFGAVAPDLDLDGDADLVIANGHILHIAEQLAPGETYKQPTQVFANQGGAVFAEVADAGLSFIGAGRGLASADLDGDGDADLAINNSDDRAVVYENLTSPLGRWLALDLAGGAGGDGIGATVTLVSAGHREVQQVRTGSSYMSQSELTLRFGLAQASTASVEVAWGDGRRQRFAALPAGSRVRLQAPAVSGRPRTAPPPAAAAPSADR